MGSPAVRVFLLLALFSALVQAQPRLVWLFFKAETPGGDEFYRLEYNESINEHSIYYAGQLYGVYNATGFYPKAPLPALPPVDSGSFIIVSGNLKNIGTDYGTGMYFPVISPIFNTPGRDGWWWGFSVPQNFLAGATKEFDNLQIPLLSFIPPQLTGGNSNPHCPFVGHVQSIGKFVYCAGVYQPWAVLWPHFVLNVSNPGHWFLLNGTMLKNPATGEYPYHIEENPDGTFNVTIAANLTYEGTLPLGAVNVTVDSAVLTGDARYSRSVRRNMFVLPGEWATVQNEFKNVPMGRIRSIYHVVNGTYPFAWREERGFKTGENYVYLWAGAPWVEPRIYLAPYDLLNITVWMWNAENVNLTPDTPAEVRLLLYDPDGYVAYNESKLVPEPGTTLPVYPHCPSSQDCYFRYVNFSINMSEKNLFDLSRARIEVWGTTGTKRINPFYDPDWLFTWYWPQGREERFETRRIIAFEVGNRKKSKADLIASLGENKELSIILRNPLSTQKIDYSLSSQASGVELNPLIPDKVEGVREADQFGWGEGSARMGVGVPEQAIDAAGSLCPYGEIKVTAAAQPPEGELARLTDAGVLRVAVTPSHARTVAAPKTSGVAAAWFGPRSASLADRGQKFASVSYYANPSLRWGENADAEVLTVTCTNYLCCTSGFCSQNAFNEMIEAFKAEANKTFWATVYRRRNLGLLKSTTGSFSLTTAAQVAGGVSLPGEFRATDRAQQCRETGWPASYVLKAETSNGVEWTYSADLMSLDGTNRFDGYGGAMPNFPLCGLNSAAPEVKCVIAPTIVDNGRLKYFGA